MVDNYRRKDATSEQKPRASKPEEKPAVDMRKSMPEASKPAFATETHQKSASMNPAEFKDVINAMTYNKGAGMTEAQWNEIVKKNAEKARQEELTHKEKLNQQKLKMRRDLEEQVKQKREQESTQKIRSKEAFLSDIERIEARAQAEDQRRARKRSQYMGAGFDIYGQVIAKNEARDEAAKKQRIQEAQERRQMEVKLREQVALDEEKAK